MKCGTGVLLKWLKTHPNLIPGVGDKLINLRRVRLKEVHFFDSSSKNETQCSNSLQKKYLKHFKSYPIKISNNNKQQYRYTFDKSPDYMRSQTKIWKINCTVPNIKFIIILRNPVERVVSEFNHHCRHGRYFKSNTSYISAFYGKPIPTYPTLQLNSKGTFLHSPCSAKDLHTFLFPPQQQKNAISNNHSFLSNVLQRREIVNGFYDVQIKEIFRM